MEEIKENKIRGNSEAVATAEEHSVPEEQGEFQGQDQDQDLKETERIALLEDKVDLLTQENRELRDKNLRTYAELENYKKRVIREKEELLKYRNEELMEHLLPIIDHLEMALQHTTTNNVEQQKDAIKEGVELILKDLFATLKKFNLEAIQSIGQPFDPLVHHAMMQVESKGEPENMVVSEFRKGYKLYDKVLRPSLVAVSKKPEKFDKKIESENLEEE